MLIYTLYNYYIILYNNYIKRYVCLFILVMCILISYIGGQEELLCSHETLHLALQNPTVYTGITGNAQKHIIICIATYTNSYNMGRSDLPDIYVQSP